MNKRAADELAQFCAEQCLAFDPNAWASTSSFDRNILKSIACYLAQTSWYGHEEELERIARQVADDRDTPVPQVDSATSVDLAYFSVAVRCRIAALEGKCREVCAEVINENCRIKSGANAGQASFALPQGELLIFP
jgi:hypothetical protein